MFRDGLGSPVKGVQSMGGARMRAGPVGRSGGSVGVQVGDE